MRCGAPPLTTHRTRARAKALGVALALGASLAVSGCTNNFLTTANQGITNGIQGSTPFSGTPSTDNGGTILTLSRVVKDALSPTDTFDLIGDGSGQIQQFCPTTGSNGASTCTCNYSYTTSSGSTETFESPTIYQETNMIRCKYTGVPATASFVNVKIHMTNSDTFSNTVVFQFSGGGISLDTSNPSTFTLVQRYQCRDIVSVSSVFGTIYDRIQSEDPSLSYPLNFYTTNMGGTFALYVANAVASFNCPSIPNDTSQGLDLTVYSVGPDSSGSKRIYPPVGSAFDRSTFLVATQPTGVFQVPINAYVAPTLPSTVNPSGNQPPPLGYGANPIPAGSGQETCPDSATIPAGYHWAKVWLFRASLAIRVAYSSGALQNLGDIDCNPGDSTDQNGNPVPTFLDCGKVASDSPSYFASISAGASSKLADRFFEGTGACFGLDPSYGTTYGPITGTAPGPGATTDASSHLVTFATAAAAGVAPGSDLYVPRDSVTGNPGDPQNGCKATETQTPATNAGICTNGFALDAHPTPINFASDVANPRADDLFVVSPESVMAQDMINPTETVIEPYTPYRFMSPDDCLSADPDSPSSPGDCNVKRKISYGIRIHGVAQSGSPGGGATDPNDAIAFPVCALQPN
jgi:hypothetical protein